MVTFWKAFVGSFFGKIAATVFVTVCVLLGVGPEKWAAFMIQGLGDWATPGLARAVFLALGLVVAATLAWPYLSRRLSSTRQSAETTKRMPLIELYHEASRRGWDFGGNTGHVFDIADGLRQAGADGDILFSGTRVHRIPALTEEGFYEDIPKDYWKTCSISAISPMKVDPLNGQLAGIQDDNKKTECYNPASGMSRLTYCDLHADRAQAMRWLNNEAKQHMGKYKAEV